MSFPLFNSHNTKCLEGEEILQFFIRHTKPFQFPFRFLDTLFIGSSNNHKQSMRLYFLTSQKKLEIEVMEINSETFLKAKEKIMEKFFRKMLTKNERMFKLFSKLEIINHTQVI